MNPNQSASPLPCSDDHLSEESYEGVVVPFVNTAVGTTSTISDAFGKSAINLRCEPSAERKGRIQELTEQWRLLRSRRVCANEREQRIRALTVQWIAIRQARTQSIE
jgi:hypothetical protein